MCVCVCVCVCVHVCVCVIIFQKMEKYLRESGEKCERMMIQLMF